MSQDSSQPTDGAPLSDDSRAKSGGEDKTVISQQPAAGASDFFRAAGIAELARVLEGKQLGHFQLDQLIGGGGMGAVFRGRDLRLQRTVAIKVVPAAEANLESLQRFQLEAQSAAKLDHPNIARVFDVGESTPWNYIVFEFIEGSNLRDLVTAEGPLSVQESVDYLRQIAEALEHAAARGVVHRDIKPSNILITPQGQAKLVDMGLARWSDVPGGTPQEITATGVTLGTFDYISPEQARDPRIADVRSDLYSLGCTWYYLLTGQPPFADGTALQKLLQHGSQKPPDPRAMRKDLSGDLVAILSRLMAKKPSQRYQQPRDLIADLDELSRREGLQRGSAGNVSRSDTSPAPAPRTIRRFLPWLAAGTVLGLVLAGMEWFDRQGQDSIEPRTIPPRPQEADNRSDRQEAVPPPGDSLPSSSLSNGSNFPGIGSVPELELPDPLPDEGMIASPPGKRTGPETEDKDSGRPPLPKMDSNDSAALEAPALSVAKPSVAASERRLTPERILISPSQLEGRYEGAISVSSWEEAIDWIDRVASIQEVRIATNNLRCSRTLALRRDLKIAPAAGYRPLLQWSPESPEDRQWISIQQGTLSLENLEWIGDLAEGSGSLAGAGAGEDRPIHGMKIAPQGRLVARQCGFTMRHPSHEGMVGFLEVGDPSLAASSEIERPSTQVTLDRCFFRGDADWLTWQGGGAQVDASHLLVAVSSRILKLQVSDPGNDRTNLLRVRIERSTLLNGRGFAQLTLPSSRTIPSRTTLSSPSTPWVQLSIQRSVLWSEGEWPWIQIEGLPEELPWESCISWDLRQCRWDLATLLLVQASGERGVAREMTWEQLPERDQRQLGKGVRWRSGIPQSYSFARKAPREFELLEPLDLGTDLSTLPIPRSSDGVGTP
ncbi:MAG: serine/threonine-protein kinase [Pirellulaceae bacterium]